jgi:hypothetical protein
MTILIVETQLPSQQIVIPKTRGWREEVGFCLRRAPGFLADEAGRE